jgi:hypothetical protein
VNLDNSLQLTTQSLQESTTLLLPSQSHSKTDETLSKMLEFEIFSPLKAFNLKQNRHEN